MAGLLDFLFPQTAAPAASAPGGFLAQLLGVGDPEASAAASASTAMQPVVGPYLRDVLTGQMAARNMPRDYYDPNRSFAANATDPRALNQAASIAMAVGPGAIRGWHGTGAVFPPEPGYPLGRFRDEFINTGQGAQTYGHGHYIAEARDTGQSYRDTVGGLATQHLFGPDGDIASGLPSRLAEIMAAKLRPAMDQRVSYLGNAIGRMWANGEPLDVPAIARHAWGGLLDTPEMMKLFESQNPEWRSTIQDAIDRAQPILSQHGIETRQPGALYEVNIHADPQQFLDWDRPLSGQNDAVRDVLTPKAAQAYQEGIVSAPPEKLTGGDAYQGIAGMFPWNGGARTDTAQASQLLRDAGIPGIRYLDQGSRGAGQGTSNYVVFDPAIIQILRKYGLAGLLGGAGAAGAAGQSQAQEPSAPPQPQYPFPWQEYIEPPPAQRR